MTSYTKLFATAAIVLLLDQLTKLWVVNNIAFNSYFYPQDSEIIEIVKGFFYIVHIGNEGAAWGMFSGHGKFLALFTLIALGAIYKFRDSLELHRKMVQLAFGMLIGGALGNLVDRILRGHVVDFIDFHLGFTIPWILSNGRYPAFNVADCGIVVGVFIYLLTGFFYSEQKKEEPSKVER
ncbi:MAG: signal peptidase II [Lentimonas sp.]